MDEQRKRVYGYRQNILNGANCKQLILEMIDGQVDHYLDQFLDKDYGAETFAEWAAKLMGVEFEPKDFRGLDFNGADIQARDQAERMAEGQVLEALEENLPAEEEPSEWNWEALAKMVNTRWHLSLRDRDLRQLGRDQVGDFLIERARAAVQKIDLAEGARFLQPDFGIQTACNWVKHKFGIDLGVEQVRGLEPAAFKQLVREQARAVYEQKEAEFPVMAGLYHFTTRDATGHKRYEREGLAQWAADRFHVELSLEDLKNKQRDEIRRDPGRAEPASSPRGRRRPPPRPTPGSAASWTRRCPPTGPCGRPTRTAGCKELSDWLKETYGYELSPDEMLRCTAERLERHLSAAVEERFRPEMRKMERAVVLQLLDTAWKDHLLAMDHLKQQRGTPRLRPDRSQGRVQTRGDADLRGNVDLRRRAGHRHRLPHGAARRRLRRLDLDGDRDDSPGRPIGGRDRLAAAGGHRGDGSGPQAPAHPQPPAARGPERSLPLRQREEVQAMLHEEGVI